MALQRPDLGSAEFWSALESDPEKLAAAVAFIDVVNLDRTLQQHAALYAWVAAAAELAAVEEEKIEWELTKARAFALLAAKKPSAPDDTTAEPSKAAKGKTVGILAAEADTNVEVMGWQQKLFTAKEKKAALRAMSKSLEHRRDMLIQISAKQRQEQGIYNR